MSRNRISLGAAATLFALLLLFHWTGSGLLAAAGGGGSGADLDADGIDNAQDNCVLVANADQSDADSDGYGDLCDADLNDDKIINFLDLGLLKSAFFSVPGDLNYNPAADFNGDGAINFLDLVEMKATFFDVPGPSGPLPLIDVGPSFVGFGELLIGDDTTISLTVANPGWVPVTVSSIAVSGNAFSVFPPTSFTIMPGDSPRSVQLGFAPQSDGFFTGTVAVNSNADLNPAITVGLNGVGRDPSPTEMPDISVAGTLEFGPVAAGLFGSRTLTLVNLGAAPLTVSSLVASNAAFSIAPLTGGLPFSVSPNQSRQVVVRFDPPAGSSGTSYTGQVSIGSDDPDTPVVSVGFSGQAVDPVPAVNVPVVSARVGPSPFDQITASTCANVGGEINFGATSLNSDTYRVVLADQQGQTVASLPSISPQGAGLVSFSGIAACGLADGIVGVRVIITRDSTDLPTFPGTPAAKNTGTLLPPVLDPVEPATVLSVVQLCGMSREKTTVRVAGGSSLVYATLDAATTAFCLDVPLKPNQQNTLVVSAIDDLAVAPRPVATAAPVQIVQVNPSDIVIVEVTSVPLDENEIAELVENGVIELDDPSNYNVSIFTIVLTVGSFPVTVSAPVAVPTGGGDPVVPGGGTWTGGSGSSGGGGGGGAPPPPPTGCTTGCTGVVAIPTPDGGVIPGVIIIDGRILTLKEFFQVTLAILNSSPTFTLSDVEGRIDLPSGLTPVAAGLGLDVSDVNAGGATDSVAIGTIAPGDTGTGQFIVRGDSIGTYNVDVDFDGFITGGPLPVPLAFEGRAGTTVQVFGPPELGVVVRHPSDPLGPDVEVNEDYELTVEITNISTRPALYTSLDLFVGGNSLLLDDSGNPLPDSRDVRDFGTIPPGGTVAATFRVQSLVQGELIACQAIASENISLTVDTGPDGAECNIANTIPAEFQPLPVDQPPTLFGINPLNGQGNIPVTSSVLATLTPASACFIADSWQNVVTQPIDGNPANGFEIVSADFVAAGTFFLEELDAFGAPVAHIPTDLTVVSPPAGGTTIATLRLGLDSPLSQTFLKSNTAYRATLIGADRGLNDAICNASNGMPMANTFQWSFSTEQNCGGLNAPTVALTAPVNGSLDQPLNQQVVLDFSNRMSPGSLAFDPASLAASTIGLYSGAMEVAGDLTGETPLPGVAVFSNLNRKFTYTPAGNLPTDETIHIRLTDGLQDECGNPLQTPPGGVRLFSFQTIPADSVAPLQPLVNPVPVVTNQANLLVSGSAEPSSTANIAGGAAPAATSVPASGLFTANVPLTPDQTNALQVTATDASGNTSAPPVLDDINGDPLIVFYDATAPSATVLTPVDGAIDVAPGTAVSVAFSEAISPGTVNSLNFSLESAGDSVPGTFALTGADSFTFTPDAPLAYASTYTVRMRANGIRDAAGNGLLVDAVSTFTTQLPPPPVIDTVDPDNGLQGETFTVTFSGSILETASAVVSDNADISGSVLSATDTSVTALIAVESLAPVGPTVLGLTTSGGTTTVPFTVVQKPPQIADIAPASGQRGTTVAAQITGAGLSGITNLTIDGSGVTLNDLGTGDDMVSDIELVIAPEAALGARTITLTTDGGSDTVSFTVSTGAGHYWRFESSPGFLADSLSSATLTPTGSPAQVSLPAGLRGADFPAIVDVNGGGANTEATEFDGLSRFDTTLTSGIADDFTIEAFVSFDALAGPSGAVIAGTRTAGIPGWFLEVRFDGIGGTQQNEVLLSVNNDGSTDIIGSGIVLQPGVDYYVAAAFDLGGGLATFYVQDLTNAGSLQIAPVGHSVSAIVPVADLTIGDSNTGGFGTDGVLDEVRLSDSALPQNELLISNAINPVITLDPAASIALTRASVPMTVSIDVPAVAGGQTIALSSSDPAVTVPASVVVPEGMTSIGFSATTGNDAGSATISATAAGFVNDSALITVQQRDLNIQVPLVGLEQTVSGTLSLGQAAPTGGVNVSLSVDDTNIATVTPASVFIAAGGTSASFNVTGGLTIGTATITADASAEGFAPDSTLVDVTNRQIDLPESRLLALLETKVFNVLVSPDPAPPGGLDINIVSSDPTVVEVLTPVVTIPEGTEFAPVSIRALKRGAVTVTASNAGFLSDSTAVSVTASISFIGSPPTIDDTESQPLWLRLDSGGALYDAPAPGVDLTVSSSDTDCVNVTSPVTVPTSDSFASTSISFAGIAALPCTATLTASNAEFDAAQIDVTVDATTLPIGSLTVAQFDGNGNRVGAGLQTRFYAYLDNAAHGGVTITLTTSDALHARLATNATTAGSPVIELFIPDGTTQSAPFYVQGVSGASGAVDLLASQALFNDDTQAIMVNPSALALTGLTTATTSLSTNNPFYVRTFTLNDAGTAVQYIQQVSAGAGALTVTLDSGTPAVGQLITTAVPGGAGSVTVQVQPGASNSPTSLAAGGVELAPLSDGDTTIVASAPGFTPFPNNDTQTVTVTQPNLTISQYDGNGNRVGAGLQTRFYVLLGGASHGGVDITLSSTDPSRVKFATDATSAGTDTLVLSVADGATSTSPFYVQGASGASGAVDLLASQALFNDDTQAIMVNPSALALTGLTSATTSLSTNNPFYVRTFTLNDAGTAVQYIQQVSAGAGALTVTLDSGTPAVGQLVTTAVPGGAGSVTVQVQPGASNSPTSLTAGGVELDPLSGGDTTIVASAPGFTPFPNNDTQTVTVTQPNLTISQYDGNGNRVGAGLQTRFYVLLGGASHGGVDITLSSTDPSRVKFATDATSAGTDTLVLSVADGATSTSPFYVQGASGASGAVDLLASQALFNDGTQAIMVNPSALALTGLTSATTSLSTNNPFYVRTFTLNDAGTAVQYIQQVSAGAGALTVTLDSGTPAVGQLVTTAVPGGAGSVTVQVQPGASNSPTSLTAGGVELDPLSGGDTTIVASAPGFTPFPNNDTQTVTVTQPNLTISQYDGNGNRVGAGLQTRFYVLLGGASHGGVDITLSSTDPSRVKFATDATSAGTDTLVLSVADGATSTSPFYVQGASGASGAVDLLASQALFNDDTQAIMVNPSALALTGLTSATTSLSTNNPFYVRTFTLNDAGTAVQYIQQVSAGAGALTVTLDSGTPAVGQLITTAVPGGAGSVTVQVQPGASNSPTSLAAGGVELDPLSDGDTTIVASAPGFTPFPNNDTQTVTVTQPNLTISQYDGNGNRVGAGLQTRFYVLLGGTDHGGFTLRIASEDPARLKLAADATTSGEAFIDLLIADGAGSSAPFYVQGITGSLGSATLTASELANPRFSEGSLAVTVNPSALVLTGLTASTTSQSANTSFYVRSYTLNDAGTAVQYNQQVSAGAGTLTVTVSSNNMAVGQLVTNEFPGGSGSVTVQVQPGTANTPTSLANDGVEFDPQSAGTTDVNASAPGFMPFPANDTVTVTVSP